VVQLRDQIRKYLLDYPRRDAASNTRFKNILTLVIIALGVLMGIALAGTATQNHDRLQLQSLDNEFRSVRQLTSGILAIRMRAIQRMAERWVAQGGIPEDAWYADARSQFRDFPDLTSLAWTDRDGLVRYNLVTPLSVTRIGQVYSRPGRSPEDVQRRIANRTIRYTPPFKYSTADSQAGLAISVPLFVHEEFDGFMTGIVNLTKMYNFYFARWINGGYTIELRHGDEVFYHTGKQRNALDPDWAKQANVDFDSQTWTITFWPAVDALKSANIIFPATLLFGSILISIILTAAMRLGLKLYFTNNELKFANNELVTARSRADLEARQKSRLLAAASHDLREPANVASLLLDSLAPMLETSEHKEIMSRAQDALARQKDNFDKILNLSRIESGRVEAIIREINVCEILSALEEAFQVTASRTHNAFHVAPSTVTVRTDPDLLNRILSNFLSNAFRYTDRGKVLLGCRRRGSELRIEIWDSGRGIAQDQHETIFDEFSRGEDEPGSSMLGPGFGLGLSITKQLAGVLDHKLTVHSQQGKGSCFFCIVPGVDFDTPKFDVRLPDEVLLTEPFAVDEQGDVLIIDDDQDTLKALDVALSSIGLKVFSAESIDAATLAVARGDCSPQLIMADYHLTGADNGIAAVRHVRDIVGRPVAAIILTGETSNAVQREIADAGLVVLQKPVRLASLTAEIRVALQMRDVRAAE